jgi:hypothetical protein
VTGAARPIATGEMSRNARFFMSGNARMNVKTLELVGLARYLRRFGFSA